MYGYKPRNRGAFYWFIALKREGRILFPQRADPNPVLVPLFIRKTRQMRGEVVA